MVKNCRAFCWSQTSNKVSSSFQLPPVWYIITQVCGQLSYLAADTLLPVCTMRDWFKSVCGTLNSLNSCLFNTLGGGGEMHLAHWKVIQVNGHTQDFIHVLIYASIKYWNNLRSFQLYAPCMAVWGRPACKAVVAGAMDGYHWFMSLLVFIQVYGITRKVFWCIKIT